MEYVQTTPFDPAKGGTVPGRCLGNVTRGYSIPSKYDTAYIAWQHTKQHADKNFPAGVAVPVFWEYVYQGKQEGHVAERLPDGRIWTDGRYYANVDELNAHYLYGKGTYLGWGESVNDVPVIKEAEMELFNDGDRKNWLREAGLQDVGQYGNLVGKATFKEAVEQMRRDNLFRINPGDAVNYSNPLGVEAKAGDLHKDFAYALVNKVKAGKPDPDGEKWRTHVANLKNSGL